MPFILFHLYWWKCEILLKCRNLKKEMPRNTREVLRDATGQKNLTRSGNYSLFKGTKIKVLIWLLIKKQTIKKGGLEKGYNLFSTLGPQGMILWGVVCTTHLGTATKFDNAGFSEYCIYSSEVWTSVLHPKFSIILNSRSTLSYENTVIAPNVWSCIRKKILPNSASRFSRPPPYKRKVICIQITQNWDASAEGISRMKTVVSPFIINILQMSSL